MHQASIAEDQIGNRNRTANLQTAGRSNHQNCEVQGAEGWSFAAPASCHNAIVELLAADVRNRIVEYVKSDLVKVEPAKLASHFRSLQPI